MTTSFYNGIGGLKLSQIGVDVLGDNIANVNTTGYKGREVSYSSGFGAMLNCCLNSAVDSSIGLTSSVSSSVVDLSQGSLANTDNVFDLAIEGKGWLAVTDENNATKYTRTGSFVRDSNGTLVTQNGEKLLVANPKNLIFKNGEWEFNNQISTENLVDIAPLSPISLPHNLIFPPEATKFVKIAGNLPNESIAPTPKPAVESSDFGVLYNRDAENMNIRSGQDLAFGFGKHIRNEKGLLRYDICVSDDEKDGKSFEVDFDVNGENIKVSLPDGSSAKTITDAVAKILDDKNILYDKTDNSITIKDKDKIQIKSNGGDLIEENSEIRRLIYQSDSNQNNDFTTMGDFKNRLQEMADFVYPEEAEVSIDDKGKIFIHNKTDKKELYSILEKTENSNNMFIENLGHLGGAIQPNTASNSLEFKRNYQGFTGDIIDKDGNKNDLKFDFYKIKIDGDKTEWSLTISEIKDNEVISQIHQNLTFDKDGGLISPNPPILTIDNVGTATKIDLGGNFTGITALDIDNSGFIYDKDGFIKGYLKNYDVNQEGEILANFSNGKTGVLGQIPIFHFQNEQGLDSLGGNLYTPTSNSGAAILYKDKNGSYLTSSKIKNYSLEMSNVNLTKAMTELIVMQKSFEANSKIVSTSDQMIQKAINMKK